MTSVVKGSFSGRALRLDRARGSEGAKGGGTFVPAWCFVLFAFLFFFGSELLKKCVESGICGCVRLEASHNNQTLPSISTELCKYLLSHVNAPPVVCWTLQLHVDVGSQRDQAMYLGPLLVSASALFRFPMW